MKIDLVIGNSEPVSLEVAGAPQRGEQIIYGGVSFLITSIAHDSDRRTTRVLCDAPFINPAVPVVANNAMQRREKRR